MPAPPLIVQTTYAELLERTASEAFQNAFDGEGAFTPKTVKGRRYWYFQTGTGTERTQKYVGPETHELVERIERHRAALSDERERRALVSMLLRSLGLPRPDPAVGSILAALAKAGVFRLRGVLVGTVAYQTYAAMLGVRLASATLQTLDVDIAQFKSVSDAAEDSTPPVLEVLKEVDESFRPVPRLSKSGVTSYAAKGGGLRVDFLAPNEGEDTGDPQNLPALQTDAQPLRFLDFLIYEPEPAVVLHEAGIWVQVPAPARYAVHKLIVSRRRNETGKRGKDTRQAETLLAALVEKRAYELKAAWDEANARGDAWSKLLSQGIGEIDSLVRDLTLKTVGATRSIVEGLDLTFDSPPARYDFSRDSVIFQGTAAGRPISCAISREALDDHFGADDMSEDERIQVFLRNRSPIEQMARAKYLYRPIEQPNAVLVKTDDVPLLLKRLSGAKPPRAEGSNPGRT